MIYTSYFANWRKFPKDLKQVSIALYPPKSFENELLELAPTQKLLSDFKMQRITIEEYTKEFNQQLAKLNPQDVKDNCILLCYEKSTDFCHRHLVRQWLNENNIKCEELV